VAHQVFLVRLMDVPSHPLIEDYEEAGTATALDLYEYPESI
jgi:hypothetical protein